MNQTMIYLDSLDWIERYSWFGYFVGLFSLNFAAYLLSLFSGHAPTYTIVKSPPQFLRFILIQRPDLLRSDGGLNALGELYLGAKTVHTQNLTAPTSTYKTVNGADIPNQGPPTAWPVVSSASRSLRTVALSSQSLLATVTSIICFFGAQWIL
jgi:hypothetical protein